MKNVMAICKMLDRIAKTVIGISGFMFVCVLAVWSIVYLNGAAIEKAQLDLRPLITSSSPILAWIWIGALVVGTASMLYWLGKEIKKGVAKARDTNLSAEEKGKSLLRWVLKHG